jgi:hypothetical protein
VFAVAVKGTIALAMVVVFGELAGYWSGATARHLVLEGWVYEKCENQRLVNPVSGLIVSTSLDSPTTTTDSQGHYELRIGTPAPGDVDDLSFRTGSAVYRSKVPEGAYQFSKFSHVRTNFVLSPPWARGDRLRPYDCPQPDPSVLP